MEKQYRMKKRRVSINTQKLQGMDALGKHITDRLTDNFDINMC